MQATLQEINAIAGVHGSFVIGTNGEIVAQAMPQTFEEARLSAVGRLAAQTLNALEISHQQIGDVDLVFEQQRLVLKHFEGGALIALCARNINLPLFNMTAATALKTLSSAPSVKPSESSATPRPASTPSSAQPSSAPSPLYAELEKEAQRLISASNSAQLKLCVMDPIAMWARTNATRARVSPPQKRQLEFLARTEQGILLMRVMERLGYQPDQRFNAFYGARFMHFNEPTRNISTYIFLDAYDMNHAVNLTSVLTQNETVMTETGLALIRLQWVEMTSTNLNEICALFLEHDLAAGADKARIDATQITRICAEDWGWYRTVTMNLDRLRAFIAKELSPSDEALVADRIQRLRQGIEAAPKTLRWQARARIGDTVRWYETPQIGGTVGLRPDIALG